MLIELIKRIIEALFSKNKPQEIPTDLDVKDIPIPESIKKPYALPGAIMSGVDPRLLEIAEEIIIELRRQGYQAVIHNARRTKEQAADNAAKGVGILKSKHITGRALDIVDSRYWWNEQYIEQIKDFRAKYGALTKKYPEITWGGTWTTGKYGALGDWAHIELK